MDMVDRVSWDYAADLAMTSERSTFTDFNRTDDNGMTVGRKSSA
jgi:hypothetical protein